MCDQKVNSTFLHKVIYRVNDFVSGKISQETFERKGSKAPIKLINEINKVEKTQLNEVSFVLEGITNLTRIPPKDESKAAAIRSFATNLVKQLTEYASNKVSVDEFSTKEMLSLNRKIDHLLPQVRPECRVELNNLQTVLHNTLKPIQQNTMKTNELSQDQLLIAQQLERKIDWDQKNGKFTPCLAEEQSSHLVSYTPFS